MTLTAAAFDAIRNPDNPMHGFPDGWVSDKNFAIRVSDPECREVRPARGRDAIRERAAIDPDGAAGARHRTKGMAAGRQPSEAGAALRTLLWLRRGPLRPGCRARVPEVPRQGRGPGRGEGGRWSDRHRVGDGGCVCLAGRFAPLVDAAASLCALDVPGAPPAVGMIDEAGALFAVALPIIGIPLVPPPAEREVHP